MTTRDRVRAPSRAPIALVCAVAALVPGRVRADAPAPSTDAIELRGVTLRPLVEVRLRGEGRTAPVERGGAIFGASAVLAEGALPVVARAGAVDSTSGLFARTRLGLEASRGPVTAVLTLQDARRLGGDESAPLRPAGEAALPVFGPYEAYVAIDLRRGGAGLRIGRQRVAWGDGRLLGASDGSPTPRSLDAARFEATFGDFDVDVVAALLAAPGESVRARSDADADAPPRLDVREGSGAELYGARLAWHLDPRLQPEVAGLARIVRDPVPASLAAGDTFVADARIAGDYRGFRYSIEGAYEGGRLATTDAPRALAALAGAARASLETALPGHLVFGLGGAYATGDDGPLAAGATQHRFDPIAPDEHEHHGAMGLFAWSNLFDLGGDLTARPADELTLRFAYGYAALAEPGGRWSTAALVPVGASAGNRERALGHELDATLALQLYEPLRLEGGYGLFLFDEGAKAVLRDEGRGDRAAQHWGFVQATARLP